MEPMYSRTSDIRGPANGRKGICRFVVMEAVSGWMVEVPSKPRVGPFESEWEAIRAADALALQHYRGGANTRVMTCRSDGRLDLVCSYGRHPDLD
jgi:hypothetical protein